MLADLQVGRYKRPVMTLFLAGFLCLGSAYAQKDDGSNPPASNESDSSAQDKDKKPEQPMVRLRIVVTGNTDKPVSNASVYVRYTVPAGPFHKEKMAELDLKTNGDGSVKVPEIPQGKILIQIIAPGWHTYGKWYDIEKDEDTVEIKLDPPHRWY
jgi:hypothetical protein